MLNANVAFPVPVILTLVHRSVLLFLVEEFVEVSQVSLGPCQDLQAGQSRPANRDMVSAPCGAKDERTGEVLVVTAVSKT